MTEREALKLALEALENIKNDPFKFDLKDDINKVTIAIKESLAQPEFIKHEVENADDWSEWVCPDPKNYLMKCCDCGLVHEAEFGVVRYKSETEREDCDMVDDPNLQAVFRMRRSEEWTPEDTAHRSGGLPMAQPEQEPCCYGGIAHDCHAGEGCRIVKRMKATSPQRTWVGLTDEDFLEACQIAERGNYLVAFQRIQAKLKEKNT